MYDGRKNSDRPRTLIFRVLRWHDRSEILKGARQAYPVKCSQDNVTLLFFPDFSPATTTRRKSFNPVLKMTALGLQPFLTYPAVIKLRHKGEQRSFDSPQKAENFISSLSQKKTYAAALQGNRKTAGMAAIPTAREKMVAGWTWTIAKSLLFFFFFPLSSWDVVPIYPTQLSLLLVRLTPFFFFFFSEGTNGE